MNSILKSFKQILAVLAIALLASGCATSAPSLEYNPWEPISLPTEATMTDVGFTQDSMHGWLVGTDSALFETKDSGYSWTEKLLNLGDDRKYTFTSVSFSGEEGWVTGQPGILLHTEDGGQSWERVPLSERLPGSPFKIVALGPNSAEMATDVGAIYKTVDAGKTWQALVQIAVGEMRNISRSDDGRYVAVSSRGSFYSTWSPGEKIWAPHNRQSSKRLQNMGFTQDGRLWLIARGGVLQFSDSDVETWSESLSPDFGNNWGLLDLAYRNSEEVWVSGGSGELLCSFDGGQTWQKDRDVKNVPGNFYKIRFLDQAQGFVLGQRGIILKYQPDLRMT
ncbi:MAG: photosynthesis system II assembly factor Ycf48 [Cyanothece sp. SIO1E1]|nr:photosynthesis system II assembly factor Ycf48 [Cyanothece sp. SIO1E1]